MNTPKQILKAAAATAVLGLISAGPAQAYSFNNSGISFDKDTTVKFDFLESHNWFQSSFGVKNTVTGEETLLINEIMNRDAGSGKYINDELGTCGESVLDCSVKFTFEAETDYEFFITRVNPDTEVASKPLSSNTHAKFLQGTSVLEDLRYQKYQTSPISDLSTTAGIQNADVFAGPVLIGFDDEFKLDDVASHVDYNDFLVTAIAVPEPATLVGLGLVAGSMALSRRRKNKQTSKSKISK